MKRVSVLIFVMLLSCSILSSCSLGDSLLSAMGFDTYDYEGEEVKKMLDTDSEEVEKLADMIRILTVNNPVLPEFSSPGEAVDDCRDAILNYMLCTGFAKYIGNTELIDEVEEIYPQLSFITVIPASDFEDCVYTFFGGNAKVSHRSSELFEYLDEAAVYTSVTEPFESKITVDVISCEKTERTCRMNFTCSLGDVTSPVYRALVVNRTDGSSYFKSLQCVDYEKSTD